MIIKPPEFLLPQLPQDFLGSLLRLLPGHSVVEEPEKHVLPNCGHEHLVVRILQDKTQFAPDLRKIPGADFITVHQNLSLCRSADTFISGSGPSEP